MRRLLLVALLLVCPWRLAGRIGEGRGFRLVGLHLLAGLALLPALVGSLWLTREIQFTAEAEGLSAPQAGLMTMLSQGIVESHVVSPGRLAATAAGWAAGGAAAGLLGSGMLGLVLLGLAGTTAAAQRPKLWALGRWASGFMPIATLGLALMVHLWTEAKMGEDPVPLLVVLGGVVPLWATAGAGALAWGALRGPCGQGRLRAAVNAVLFGLLLWFVTLLALQLAGLISWLPAALVDRT